MRQITLRMIIALGAFAVGLTAAAVWLPRSSRETCTLTTTAVNVEKPAPVSPAADSTVYGVKFCELLQNPQKYDGKIVRIQALYRQAVDAPSLFDPHCEGWVAPRCDDQEAPCEEIWHRLRSFDSEIGFYDSKIDAVGRYFSDVADPHENGYHVHLFKVLELKSARPDKKR